MPQPNIRHHRRHFGRELASCLVSRDFRGNQSPFLNRSIITTRRTSRPGSGDLTRKPPERQAAPPPKINESVRWVAEKGQVHELTLRGLRSRRHRADAKRLMTRLKKLYPVLSHPTGSKFATVDSLKEALCGTREVKSYNCHGLSSPRGMTKSATRRQADPPTLLPPRSRIAPKHEF